MSSKCIYNPITTILLSGKAYIPSLSAYFFEEIKTSSVFDVL